MKATITLQMILMLIISNYCFAQKASSEIIEINERLDVFTNNTQQPCISDSEYQILEAEVLKNQKSLGSNKLVSKQAAPPLLSWPLRPSAKLKDYSYYKISAYVDQNTAVGAMEDFNCGTITYDGHKGTDIATWPFNFYKMDNDLVEVVAAASGTIVAKHDGEYDRNCAQSSALANYVILKHADGSQALYWHMKNGSVTTKDVGAAVLVGEYLGVVGSSGSSSGPHLHFEVWSGATNATRIDPYSGACNTLNANSWWANQKPHKETSIVKASVHTTDAVFPGCPSTETLNESASFSIPFQGPNLAAGYAKFYIFIRDEVSGLVANMSILKPDGSTYLNWTYNSTSSNGARYVKYSKLLPTIPGTYTYQASYNGITTSTQFKIESTLGVSKLAEGTLVNIYPNPSNGTLTIETDSFNLLNSDFKVFNALGALVYDSKLTSNLSQLQLNLTSGIYYYKITSKDGAEALGKLLIDN